MHQSDKPTIAWAVVQSSHGWRPAVREIISRTPKGMRLRSMRGSWRVNKAGDMCSLNDLKAEFPTEAEANAAVERSVAAYERLTDHVMSLRADQVKAELACRQAVQDQRDSALAAITQEPDTSC